MKRQIITLILLAALLLTGGSVMLASKHPISMSERRKLAQWPCPHWQGVLTGSFREEAEKAASDQFPLRDSFRRLKAYVQFGLLGQRDNNGIYVVNGTASKLEYPLRERSVERAAEKIQSIWQTYLSESDVKCYYSIIPDKNFFLARQNGYPAMDYDKLRQIMADGLSGWTYLDLFDSLSIEDYYTTDPHWRQERLQPVAQVLADGLAVPLSWDYTSHTIDPFYGAYYGQSALPLQPDQLVYLTSRSLDGCSVYNLETDSYGAIYDLQKGAGRDPYELYLSGAAALQVIVNSNAQTRRELVVFRDSFGSSVIPLLAGSYQKITLVDLRYISSSLLDQYLDFQQQDVLFLYSTLILNNSTALK